MAYLFNHFYTSIYNRRSRNGHLKCEHSVVAYEMRWPLTEELNQRVFPNITPDTYFLKENLLHVLVHIAKIKITPRVK